MIQKYLHIIGIGGIGVSALARYYHHLGYTVSGSDGSDSPFLETLRGEWFEIHIGHDAENLPENTDLVIYSEAIITKPDLTPEEQIYSNPELARARDLGIRHISYPVALGEVFNAKNGIAITGSHGKSTTTAMTGILLSNISSINNGKRNTFSEQNPQPPHSSSTAPLQKELIAPGTSVLVGTQVPQLGNSNFHFEESENFVIEACEYKRSFLQYHPYITVITNIDLDHLDYYTSLEDYISAFQSLVDQTSGFVIISADDENSQKLQIPVEKKIVVGTRMFDSSNLGILDETDSNTPALQSAAADNIPNITYYPRVEEDCCGVKKIYTVEKNMTIPKMQLQVPGEHLLHDAHLAYTVGRLLGMQDDTIVQKLESYTGSWRRSEIVWTTENGNIVMSDYGHHPNEIRPTLRAIREKYPEKKLFVIFQPHQYSRTRELLHEFAMSFSDASELIIPNIYFSRDKQEDVEWMTTERLIEEIEKVEKKLEEVWEGGGKEVGKVIEKAAAKKAPLQRGDGVSQGGKRILNGDWLENTAKLIREYDEKNPDSSIILILGAGDVDGLRYEII